MRRPDAGASSWLPAQGMDLRNGMEWNGMEWKGMEWNGSNGLDLNGSIADGAPTG